jgi:hypothetical protein
MLRFSRSVSTNIVKRYVPNNIKKFYRNEQKRLLHNEEMNTKYNHIFTFGSAFIGFGTAIHLCNKNDEYNRKYYEGYVRGRTQFTNFEKFFMGMNGFTIGMLVGHTYSISVPIIGLSYILYKNVKSDKVNILDM